MLSRSQSLTIKFGSILIVAQLLVLGVVGFIYIQKFSAQVDRRIELQAHLPGELMNAGLLNINAMSDRRKMEQLVGHTLKNLLVVGANGIVFSALDENDAGSSYGDLPGLVDQENLKLSRQTIKNRNELISITPIFASDGKTPRFFVYVGVSSDEGTGEKNRLIILFVLGSFFTLVISTAIIFVFFKYLVFDRLSAIGATLKQVEAGDLSARLRADGNLDEIGVLGRGVNRMVSALEENIASLKTEIDERKQVEKALRTSEEQYRQLIENANDAVFIAQGGRIVFFNKRTAEILGYREEEVRGAAFSNFIHPDDRAMVVKNYNQRIKGESGLPPQYSFRALPKDHSELIIQLSAVLIEWNDEPATLNFARDLTEQLRMERSLYQAQKMEAIGTLAGGIAHDFNNLLMAIQGRSSLMSAQLDSHDPLVEHVDAIGDYIKSATNLTSQLLGTARGGKYDPKPVDLNLLIERSVSMFGRTRKDIRVDWELCKNPVIVEVDKQQIEQVLLNIYVNAGQAMQAGGELKVHTSIETISDPSHEKFTGSAEPYGVVSISDTGVGMDEITRQQIFDPFFTTKEKGRGTGLGLASAYGIIKNHDGFITVTSEQGIGSTFSIHLPLSDKRPEPEDPLQLELKRGSERILLVDDEQVILEVGRALLEELGYSAITAAGGAEALQVLEQEGAAISLVILDLIMPEMDGGQTFDRIKKIVPRMPVILSSGYSMDGQATEIMGRGCEGFMQKPYDLHTLSQKIRQVLDDVGESVS